MLTEYDNNNLKNNNDENHNKVEVEKSTLAGHGSAASYHSYQEEDNTDHYHRDQDRIDVVPEVDITFKITLEKSTSLNPIYKTKRKVPTFYTNYYTVIKTIIITLTSNPLVQGRSQTSWRRRCHRQPA